MNAPMPRPSTFHYAPMFPLAPDPTPYRRLAIEGVTSFGAGSSGALRYLTPMEVRDIAAALANVEASGLLSKLDFAAAQNKKIYLAHTLDDLDGWSYLPEVFVNFRNFYAEAAGAGRGMLLSIV